MVAQAGAGNSGVTEAGVDGQTGKLFFLPQQNILAGGQIRIRAG